MERDYRKEYEDNQRKLDALTDSFKADGTTHVYDSLMNTILTIGENGERANETTILGKEGRLSDIRMKTIPVPETDTDFKKQVEAQELTIDGLEERRNVVAPRGFIYKDRKHFITKEIPGMNLEKILGQGGMGVVYKGLLDFSKMTVFGLGLIRAAQETWIEAEEKNLGERTLAEIPKIRERKLLEAYEEKKKKTELIDEIFAFYENNNLGHLARFTPIDVVYKLVKKKYKNDRDMIRRFEREQLLAGYSNSSMAHAILAGKPNINLGETPFVCIEYLPNIMPFKAVKKLSAKTKLEISKIGAYALWSIMKMGGYHRDFKPDNFPIIPVKEQNLVIPKLLDYGLLGIEHKSIDSFHTVPGQSFFSPLFAAPEQAKKRYEPSSEIPINYQADVFSLGAYMYELMTLKSIYHNVPEEKKSSDGIALTLYENRHPPSVPELTKESIDDLTLEQLKETELIITAALQREVKNRYSHCGHVHDDLDSVLNGSHAKYAREISEKMGYNGFINGAYGNSTLVVDTSEIENVTIDTETNNNSKKKPGLKTRLLGMIGLKKK